MTLYIKNMVCDRCKAAVKDAFTRNGIAFEAVELGEVVVEKRPGDSQLKNLDRDLRNLGFEILESKAARIITQIKSAVVEYVHYKEDQKINFSKFISEKLHREYSGLSSLFSE